MENNNSSIVATILVYASFILIIIGASGLDSESIVLPSVLIMAGLVCGMIAFFSGKNL